MCFFFKHRKFHEVWSNGYRDTAGNMAGGDELSARLPVAERVSLPVRLKQRAIIPFLTDTAVKIRPIQINTILKTAYGDDCISVLMSVRFAVRRSAPLKPVMLLVMLNLMAPPTADAPSPHDRTVAECWSPNQGESQHCQTVLCNWEECFSRTCASDWSSTMAWDLDKEKFVDIECVDHAACSSDLASSDYHLFGKLKEHLRGRRFACDDKLKRTVKCWPTSQVAHFYSARPAKLPGRWQTFINCDGGYVE